MQQQHPLAGPVLHQVAHFAGSHVLMILRGICRARALLTEAKEIEGASWWKSI